MKKKLDLKLKKIKVIFLEKSLHSTAQCYPKIFETKNLFARFLWSLIFLLFSGFTSYLILRELLGYFDYSVVSTIKIVHQIPAPFPAIQICNSEFLTKEMNHILKQIMKENYKNETNDSRVYFERVESVTQQVKMSVKEMKNRSVYTKAPPLVKCQFDKLACDLNNDITYSYNYKHGECLRFNWATNDTYLKISRIENENNGLKIWIGPILDTGLKIFVTNQSFFPLSNDGIYVKGGEEVFIKVLRQFSYNTPYPYSSCIDMENFNSNFYRKTMDFHQKYSQAYCIRFCIQKLIIDNCQCYHPKYNKLDDTTQPCQNLTHQECIDIHENMFIGEQINKCHLECPLECQKVTFELQSSSFDMSRQQFEAYFKKNETELYDEARKNFIILNVFYPHLEYTEITVEPKMSVIDLISNLGGALGIFLGLSIFNFVEIVECVFMGFYILLQ